MLVVVRHGNTFEPGEAPRRIGARTDLPLTSGGMDQARALGRHFAVLGWKFSRALISPLLRTRQTAQAILAEQLERGPPCETADFLREIDHGLDENSTEEEVLQRVGRDALAAWDNHGEPPSGWRVESAPRVAAWRELLTGDAGLAGPILLVTSNGAARFALKADRSLEEQAANLASLKLPTGGYGVITRDEAGALCLESWGIRP